MQWRRGTREGGGERALRSAAPSAANGLKRRSWSGSAELWSKHAREGFTESTPINSTIEATLYCSRLSP